MKKIISILFFACLVQPFFAQLKIVPGGNVGIGTLSPIGKLHVNGRIFLTGNGHIFRILPDNPGTEIGTTTDRIDFWSTTVGHHRLYAQKYFTQSDSSTKDSIVMLSNASAVIQSLNGYSYVIVDGDSLSTPEYGLLAQEVELVAPVLVDSSKGIKLLDYNGIIALLVQAHKEQQHELDSLKELFTILRQHHEECCGAIQSQMKSGTPKDSPFEEAILKDNIPNPFSESTQIGYRIPQFSGSAMLNIYDLQGKEIRSYPISGRGEGSITVPANDLQAGIYLYSLIVDKQIIDTKKMIRTSR